eukprot:gnl/TRDRNA2_/TRDRNA2_42509_c0_seq1.p1 gnl/TRDRNA2_/TRDRNA2_42509_c0~~gnl/TRDRNA2_/TRDRNA2_42509_c0_seq1.p1  ORF type:complete len:180 (-),score=12.64 gnl/TRDRNA2_/TRDRNA2_42509_c0_seq1:158-697(-)
MQERIANPLSVVMFMLLLAIMISLFHSCTQYSSSRNCISQEHSFIRIHVSKTIVHSKPAATNLRGESEAHQLGNMLSTAISAVKKYFQFWKDKLMIPFQFFDDFTKQIGKYARKRNERGEKKKRCIALMREDEIHRWWKCHGWKAFFDPFHSFDTCMSSQYEPWDCGRVSWYGQVIKID